MDAGRTAGSMEISLTQTDNITEVLGKIIEFTERRDKVLIRNIEEFHQEDFVPMDLDVTVFAELMTMAVSEHIRNDRLLLCDSDNIRFGRAGAFETRTTVDEKAKHLLMNNKKKYIEMQIAKLSENLINKRTAVKLLEQKQLQQVNLAE